MKKRTVAGVGISLGLALILGACGTPPQETEDHTEIHQQQLTVGASRMPIDNAPIIRVGRPKFSKPAPEFRRATPDEVEVLEGTYRTEASREDLLAAIKNGDAELRDERVAKFKQVVGPLPEGQRQRALSRLAEILGK
jgi:hypothetical protein